MTCKNAHHAGALTRTDNLFFCHAWTEDFQGQSGCAAISRVLVEGNGIGCLDHYERNAAEYHRVWSYELEEAAHEESRKQPQWADIPRVLAYGQGDMHAPR